MTRPDLPADVPRQPGLLPRSAAARHRAADVAIAVVVIAIQVGGTYASAGHHGQASAGTMTYVLLAVGGAALMARRRYPVSVLAVTLAVAIWPGVASQARPVWIALIVAFFTAVQARQRAAAIASLVIGYAASIWPPWLIGTHGHTSAGFAVALAILLLFLLAVAEVIRARGQRTAALEHSHQEELRRRAGEERMRIARDLHDVVAHNISVINVQANTALHLMDRQPDRARSALTTINEVSGQALVELRSVLGVLRAVDEEAPRGPAPGLARLGDLADTAAAAGLAVRVKESGQRAPLPADVDLAAYRIVQEALTNSARHSGGRNAIIRIVYGKDALVVEVDDDGARRPAGRSPGQAHGTGSGIAGMTERAAALGGTLQAGPRPGGGFAVQARLPLRGLAPGRDDRVIRVALADDQELVRAGFAALLDAEDDIDVVGEAADGEQAVALAARSAPDVLLMDIRMPGLDGIEATRRIAARPDLAPVHVVILTTFDLDEYVFEGLRAGAAGFLVKDTHAAELIRAVRVVASGEALLSPAVTRRLIAEFALRTRSPRSLPHLDELTPREREVLALIATGLSNDEISRQIFVSPATVKTHASRAMTKLGARDRAQLVVFAYQAGLVRPG